MIRLGISVEGSTEREFVHHVLNPHLLAFNVFARAVDLGGNVSIDRIRSRLPAMFGNFEQVSTLYDFYGFKRRGNHDLASLTTAITETVPEQSRRRLTPYVQLHEFEALLFAVPKITVEQLGGSTGHLHEMQQAVAAAGNPEAVNDSPQTSPSHRLHHLFGTTFQKKIHGPKIIAAAGLPAIREQCPRFDAWITRLEALGER